MTNEISQNAQSWQRMWVPLKNVVPHSLPHFQISCSQSFSGRRAVGYLNGCEVPRRRSVARRNNDAHHVLRAWWGVRWGSEEPWVSFYILPHRGIPNNPQMGGWLILGFTALHSLPKTGATWRMATRKIRPPWHIKEVMEAPPIWIYKCNIQSPPSLVRSLGGRCR